jgi:protease IV
MSDVAASGGYYISMAADAIVAQPGTVTGSIGVVFGKPALGEMLGKAGVTTDSVIQGEHAAMFSTTHPFTEAEWVLVNNWLDHVYADFTGKVAAGRGMSAARVHELARGRVWTGADALECGLIDEVGGLEDAAAIARRRAGLPDSAPLDPFPKTNPLDRLRPALSSEDRRAAAHVARHAPGAAGGAWAEVAGAAAAGITGIAGAVAASLFAESWGPAWQLAARCGLPHDGPLMLPGSWTFH